MNRLDEQSKVQQEILTHREKRSFSHLIDEYTEERINRVAKATDLIVEMMHYCGDSDGDMSVNAEDVAYLLEYLNEDLKYIKNDLFSLGKNKSLEDLGIA